MIDASIATIQSRGPYRGSGASAAEPATAGCRWQTKDEDMADEIVNQAPAEGAAAPAPRTGGYQGTRPAGARPPRPAGGPGGSGPGGRKFFRRKKVCKFTVEKIDTISYRDVRLLQQFVSDRGKIIPRRLTGTSAPFQRKLTRAIKQARAIALLPFAAKF
jgi:small subunit ribosomal protein S18